jgi:2-succinyl-6-hydroxy-2,4-cyclohexadiene-1-carboxylate synthase
MKIHASGMSINYEIEGQGENLILIHGAFDNLNMWYNQVPIFSKNYRVITYDIRGFGKTESPANEYSISLFAEDLYELTKAIEIENAFCLGFSLGGSIAVQLAIDHPEIVKALVLTNSSAGLAIATPSPRALERGQEILELLDTGDIRTAAELMAAAAFSPDFKSKNPVEFERFIKSKLQNDPHKLAQVMRSLRGGVSAPDISSRLKCPTLIIVGEYDSGMGPKQGKQLQQAIPNSKLVILAAGHSSPFEAPDEFNRAVLEFLSELRDV